MQEYSGDATLRWTPAHAGTYAVQVWVRNAGSLTDWDTFQTSGFFTARPPSPVTLTNFSATPSLPLQTGDEVTWRATAVGGIGPLQYQFWLLEPGTGWRVLQEWSTRNVTTWTPATPGSYIVQVWVRSAGSSLPYEAWAGMGPFSVANGPLAVNAVAANRELPIVPGATVTWRATTSGGDGTPLEFQFFRYNYQSNAWTIVQAYSASPEWTWTPTSSEVGGYHLQVWVRRQGFPQPWVWTNSAPFYVAAFPLTVTLTSNQGDPPNVPPGTPITWHARTLGATTPLEYVFWRYDAQHQVWNVVQPYSAADTYSWTPSSSDAGQTVLQVWVRPVGSSDPFLAWAGTGWFGIFP
jgi:hypothetical protein